MQVNRPHPDFTQKVLLREVIQEELLILNREVSQEQVIQALLVDTQVLLPLSLSNPEQEEDFSAVRLDFAKRN